MFVYLFALLCSLLYLQQLEHGDSRQGGEGQQDLRIRAIKVRFGREGMVVRKSG